MYIVKFLRFLTNHMTVSSCILELKGGILLIPDHEYAVLVAPVFDKSTCQVWKCLF